MSRLQLHALPRKYQDQVAAQLYGPKVLAPGLRHPEPEQDAQPQPLGAGQDEKGGAGRVKVRITRFGGKLLDADNCAGAAKFILDACRYDNLIPDDDPASIILEVHQVKTPNKADRGTLIEITPLE